MDWWCSQCQYATAHICREADDRSTTNSSNTQVCDSGAGVGGAVLQCTLRKHWSALCAAASRLPEQLQCASRALRMRSRVSLIHGQRLPNPKLNNIVRDMLKKVKFHRFAAPVGIANLLKPEYADLYCVIICRCNRCEPDSGTADAPIYVNASAPKQQRPTICLTMDSKVNQFSCEATSASNHRLCPCIEAS